MVRHSPQEGRDADPVQGCSDWRAGNAATCGARANIPGADWQRKTPADAGINPQLLKDAIDFAIANETKNPRDLQLNHYQTFGREPFGDAIGPFRTRGDPTGVDRAQRLHRRRVGRSARVDMTHSVTKSFLSTVVGLAFDRRHDPQRRRYRAAIRAADPVFDRVGAVNRPSAMARRTLIDPFATPHNRTHHLGPSAAADERLGGHALGQARLGRPAGRQAGEVAHAPAQRAGHRRTSTTTCA